MSMFQTLNIGKRHKKLINRDYPYTCKTKLLTITLHWVATCVQSTSSKTYSIYYETIHLTLHKSSLTGDLMPLFCLE